jgi:hypothetical protein
MNNFQNNSASSDKTKSQTVKCGNPFKAVVYDDFAGDPLVVTFLGGQWWVTTPGEKVQPLSDYFEGDSIECRFLCEAGGRVGALALAKMLGKALENPEDYVDKVMRQRVMRLERLGVTLDVKDEPLVMELDIFTNYDKPARQANYSAVCHLDGNCFETIFDCDAFETRRDAVEWTGYYFELLEELGIEFKIVKGNRYGTDC